MEKKPMMRTSIFILLAVSLSIGCTENAKENTSIVEDVQEQNTAIVKGMTSLDLSAHGDFSTMMIPDKSRSGVDASVLMDDASGYLSVRVGKKFQLLIREEPTTLEDIKQELANDLMWTNTISEHDAHSIMIEKSLPDGSMAQFHFATVLPGVGTNVILKSDPMGEFSQKDIERMLYSANTLTASNGLAMAQNK